VPCGFFEIADAIRAEKMRGPDSGAFGVENWGQYSPARKFKNNGGENGAKTQKGRDCQPLEKIRWLTSALRATGYPPS